VFKATMPMKINDKQKMEGTLRNANPKNFFTQTTEYGKQKNNMNIEK
jgi:hypothetical protein